MSATVLYMSMSLDGFIAGPNEGPGNGLGDEWILHFSVKGDEAWLTAEKTDGSQHVEAQTADVLLDAVDLLEEGGGRSG